MKPTNQSRASFSRSPSKIKPAQMRELKKNFESMDKNKDGSLSKDELRELMQSTNKKITNDQINNMLAMADADGDG